MSNPIKEPEADPAGTAPSGAVSPQAQCCANAASFEGSPAASKVYGLDPKTCIPASQGGEYWASGSVSGSAPADRLTRDGARWASVGVGMETELEITFDDESAAGCIANSTFHMEPGHIASIETSVVSAKRAQFRIKGQAEGDATLVVRCNGVDKGWFHVACLSLIERRIETGTVVTNRTQAVAYDAQGMQDYFNRLFRQAIISVKIVDLGTIDLTNSPMIAAITAAEEQFYYDHHPLTGRSNVFFAPDPADLEGPLHFGQVVLPLIDAAIGPRPGAERLLRYIPKAPYTSINNGVVSAIGSGPGAVFKEYEEGEDWSHNVLCHEYGHIFGLEHPDEASPDQIPEHLANSTNVPIPAFAGSNTEKASPAVEAHPRIMALDPLNLMGYWDKIGEQLPIRRDQWTILRKST